MKTAIAISIMLSLFLCLEIKGMVSSNLSFVSIEKDGILYLNNTTNEDKIVLLNLKGLPNDENWKRKRIFSAKYLPNDIIEVVVFQMVYYFFNEKNSKDCAIILRYNLKRNCIIHQEVILHLEGTPALNYYYIQKDSINESFQINTFNEFYNMFSNNKTKCVNSYSYFIQDFNTFKKIKCDKLLNLKNDAQRIIYKPNEASHKFCYWGFENLLLSNNNKLLILDFGTEKYSFHWKRESISEIIEYDIDKQEFTLICDYGRRPSYSADSKNILYEKVYQPFGYTNIRSEGYYFYNKNSVKSQFVGNFLDAKMVE